MKISEKIKNLRLKRNLSQKELVSLSGISQSKLSKIENDEIINPHLEDLRKISIALGVHLQELLPGDPSAQQINITKPQSDQEALLHKYYVQFADIKDSDGKHALFIKLHEDMQTFITRRKNYQSYLGE